MYRCLFCKYIICGVEHISLFRRAINTIEKHIKSSIYVLALIWKKWNWNALQQKFIYRSFFSMTDIQQQKYKSTRKRTINALMDGFIDKLIGRIFLRCGSCWNWKMMQCRNHVSFIISHLKQIEENGCLKNFCTLIAHRNSLKIGECWYIKHTNTINFADVVCLLIHI